MSLLEMSDDVLMMIISNGDCGCVINLMKTNRKLKNLIKI